MLTGPTPSAQKALAKAGLTVDDIDLFELNEAFAAVVLKFMKDLKVPHEKINVNGGAIALGHPLGATGAMILGTLVDELEARDLRYGLATLCVGGGMGVATIVERICHERVHHANVDPLRQGRRRHRHPDPGRPGAAREHHERRLPLVARRDGRPPRGREGLDHRRHRHLGEGHLLRRRRPAPADPGHRRERARVRRRRREDQGRLPPLREARQAHRRGAERRRPRRRPRDRARLQPAHRARQPEGAVRPARGHPRPAAGRRRRHPHRPAARHRRRPDEGAAAGQPLQARRRRVEIGLVDEVVATPEEMLADGPRLDQGQPRDDPAVGRQGLPDARRHADQPRARRHAAGVPGQPAQAAQGRPDARAAPHHVRRGRGRRAGLRHRAHRRGPLLRRTSPRARSRRT